MMAKRDDVPKIDPSEIESLIKTTWRNLPSIFLILHDFDYLPRFFSVSPFSILARRLRSTQEA
jgi:hypothetical protein